jgi:predicted DNA-binding protein
MASNDTAVFLRLPSDLKAKLHELSRQRGGRKFSSMIREALEEFVEKNTVKA